MKLFDNGVCSMSFFDSKEIKLNKKYAAIEKWCPSDFGAAFFDEFFILKVKEFQKQYGLEVDGVVGPSTYRRLMTEKEAKQIASQKNIICNGVKIPILWGKVITFEDKNGFVAPENTYKKADRTKIDMFVCHFDVCFSSASCFKVLKERKLSVQFMIDNDGTIFQTMDTKHIAWHAAGVNVNSVGVEISNAFYSKYQNTYEKMGLNKRPIIKDSIIHGQKLEPHLGFYPEQLKALSALCKSLNGGVGIELQTPDSFTIVPEIVNGTYKGIFHHYNLTTNKIDSAGLDLHQIINGV